MSEMKVSTTVGMSVTVGGNVRNSGGYVRNSREIEYGLGNLRVGIAIHNCDRLPFRVHAITCKKPIRI